MNLARVSGDWRYGIISDFLTDSGGVLGMLSRTGNAISIDAEKRDGLVRVLAEPNIVSISGQEASFLAGGRIFIPVSRSNVALGVPTITLEEKEFGVGLKFTPTVLEGDRINLRVSPEVSELAQSGSPFATVNGITSILPSFTTRRAQTTVQLRDGQSFAIAGLIKNNVTETIRRFPILGEIPILGALFRSSEFQTDRSELMFIVTARLVKPIAGGYSAPTDHWTPPSRSEFFLGGQLEGSGNADVPPVRPESTGPVPVPATAVVPASAVLPPTAVVPEPRPTPPAPSAPGGFQLR
jgi:pilus assembly protein CpaC